MKSYTLVACHCSAIVAFISLMAAMKAVRTATAFVIPSNLLGSGISSKTCTLSSPTILSMAAETEVEKLLRMARELRAQAEESEKQVQEKVADKKADKKVRLGGLLNLLWYDGTKGPDVGTPDMAINALSSVANKLRSKNPSVDTLEQLVDWMDERRDIALGNEHVEKAGGGYASIKSQKDLAEAERLNMLIESLLDALQVIDNEKDPNQKHEKGHLGSGHTSEDLRRRLRENRRERDEQFLERQNSFVEAQTIKEGKSKYEYHDEFLDDLD